MNVVAQIAKLPAAKRAVAVKSAIALGLLTREQALRMERDKQDDVAALRQLFDARIDACAIAAGAVVAWRPASMAA